MARRMGVDVAMVACLGDDSYGTDYVKSLCDDGIDCGSVRRDPGAATGVAQVCVLEVMFNYHNMQPRVPVFASYHTFGVRCLHGVEVIPQRVGFSIRAYDGRVRDMDSSDVLSVSEDPSRETHVACVCCVGGKADDFMSSTTNRLYTREPIDREKPSI